MSKIALIAIVLLALALPAAAQQDLDDPGIQDSIIFQCVPDHLDSVGTAQDFDIEVYVVTDDSVRFYIMPLRCQAQQVIFTQRYPTTYFWPVNLWDEHFDTLIVGGNFIFQMGIATTSGDNKPPLLTDGQRLHAWTLHLNISPNIPSQLIVFDTCFDDRNGSVLFVPDLLGELGITPAIQRGFLSIGTVGVGESGPLPGNFQLAQNYPNPFNSSTTIEFILPAEADIELAIYDLLGRRVRILDSSHCGAGAYAAIWDGADYAGRTAPSGVYFYVLRAGDLLATKKMTMIK